MGDSARSHESVMRPVFGHEVLERAVPLPVRCMQGAAAATGRMDSAEAAVCAFETAQARQDPSHVEETAMYGYLRMAAWEDGGREAPSYLIGSPL